MGKKERVAEEEVTVCSMRSLNVNGITPAQMLPLIRILKVLCCCVCARVQRKRCVTLLLQATAPVKLQVEEALTRGVSSFQDVLQQQKDTLRQLQDDYNSYTGQACLHPSVVLQVGLRFGD